MTPHRNDAWQTAVRGLLKQGYGVENIAIKLKCDVQDVRREVAILRDSGEIARMFPARKDKA